MKKLKQITFILFISLFFVNCNDDNETIKRYLSNPRDNKLLGWWARCNLDDRPMYINFGQNGKISLIQRLDTGEYSKQINRVYWYTDEGVDKNVLYEFDIMGFPKGSFKFKSFYKIVEDSLWWSENEDCELYFWGIRTKEPIIE